MFRHSLPMSVALACTVFAASPAYAVIETWVSGTGTDASNCPRSAPCRTFAYALTKTNSGGTINVATPGSFGPVTINKSVSIVADGVEAVINTTVSGAAIFIQTSNTSVVSLRGLTIDVPAGASGIQFHSGAALHVERCTFRGGSYGIAFLPTAGVRELYVSDTAVMNSSSHGIDVHPFDNADVRAVISRVRVENAGDFAGIGFNASDSTGSVVGVVRDSVVSRTAGTGIRADNVGGPGPVEVMVERTVSSNNGFGVDAFGGTTLRIGDSTVSGNGQGLRTGGGGAIRSYGTNKIDGNGTDGTPTSTLTMR